MRRVFCSLNFFLKNHGKKYNSTIRIRAKNYYLKMEEKEPKRMKWRSSKIQNLFSNSGDNSF